MQHEAAAGFDRAAEMDPGAAADPHRLDAKLFHQLGERELIEELVDHDPHCALFVVGAHQDHGPGKARVLHLRHGNEELSGQ